MMHICISRPQWVNVYLCTTIFLSTQAGPALEHPILCWVVLLFYERLDLVRTWQVVWVQGDHSHFVRDPSIDPHPDQDECLCVESCCHHTVIHRISVIQLTKSTITASARYTFLPSPNCLCSYCFHPIQRVIQTLISIKIYVVSCCQCTVVHRISVVQLSNTSYKYYGLIGASTIMTGSKVVAFSNIYKKYAYIQ